jgi:hypothetical protein
MAKRVVLQAQRATASRLFRDGENQARIELDVTARQLEPDGAFFVTVENFTANDDRALAVARLRNRLRAMLVDYRFTYVEDAGRGGVWVYRPSSPGPGNGRAVGPTKEAEIRRRAIDR